MSSTTFSKASNFVPSAPEHEVNNVETGEVSMESLLIIPKTQCFTIQQGQKVCCGTGDLQCLTSSNDSLLIYIPSVFHYAINNSFPSLRASKYSFVFPGKNHMCFGVIFPTDTKFEDIQKFEGLLIQYSQYQSQQGENENVDNNNNNKNKERIFSDMKLDVTDEDIEKTGKSISNGIKKGAEIASKGIKKGTVIASKGIKKGTVIATKGIIMAKNYMKSKMNVQENATVDPKTLQRIQIAKGASQVAVQVSKAVAIGAYTACNELANSLSEAASKTEFGQSIINNKSVKMEIAKDITKNTIAGAFVIYEELQNAAIVLVSEIADASADVVEHRYGKEMGSAAKQTAGIVKDSAHIIKNVTDVRLTPITAYIVGVTIVDTISTDEEKMKQIRHNISNSGSDVKTAAMLGMMTQATIASNSFVQKI